MADITIHFNLDGAAAEESGEFSFVADILRSLADRFDESAGMAIITSQEQIPSIIRDPNGNTVGSVDLKL